MEVKCKYSEDKGYDGGLYVCSVESAEIFKTDTKIEAFAGEHIPGKSNKDVERIEFIGNKVDCFPRGLGQHFPILKKIWIDGSWNNTSDLKELTRQDLADLEQLTLLWIDHAKLETLPLDLLKDMNQLKSISFYCNNLKFIDSRMFEHIKDQLTFLELRGNINIDAVFDPEGVYDNDEDDSGNTIEQVMKLIDEKCVKPEVQHRIDREKSNIDFFEKLWTSRCFSDFTIVVDKEEMKVHKTVLGIQSSVFAAMFESDMEGSKSGQMKIVDFSANAVENFLKFLYTGVVPDATNAKEVFALAWKYDVEDLKQVMETIIASNIDKDNAIEVLKLGNLHSSRFLISISFNEVKSSNPELELADEMKFKPEVVEELIAAKIATKLQLDLQVEEARSRN